VSLDAAVELQSAVGDRYQIAREIGRGGMATVYLAEDIRHGRLVALKVLQPEFARAVGQARFRREIAIAAQLQHPHILPLLDSGEGAGDVGPFWYTMPYVEGESLRARLSRERQLPLSDALHITREVASALDYAHRRGVVHRDVKPENILLAPDGEALLADFGVARDRWSAALESASGGGNAGRLTDAGVSLGTLEYMSPEQTAGASEVDGRTDVYAVACVLYEMLAGEPPFTGATPQALVARRLVERPLPLRAVRDRIPESVEAAVEIALSRSPADRYKTAGEFAAALTVGSNDYPASQPRGQGTTRDAVPAVTRPSREAIGHHGSPAGGAAVEAPQGRVASWVRRAVTVAVAVLAIAAIGVHVAVERYGAEHRGVMLAVLPFESVGDSTARYFTDGVTDEIRGALAQMPGLQVIARGSSLTYTHTTKPPDQIARELDVPYLLTGQVRWLTQAKGTAIARVEAELIQAPRGHSPTVYWRQEFDIDPSNVVAVQADIASQVASVLDIVLGPGERQALHERPTNNVNAYVAFLQGDEATQHLTTTDPPAL
jgi:TolB-like protein